MALNNNQFNKLVDLYEYEMVSLKGQMGKDVLLVFPALIINIDEDMTDPARGGNKKPYYKGDEPLPEEQRETKIIRAFTRHNPLDYESFGLKIRHPQDIVKLKTLCTDVPDLKRAEYIIPDINVQDLIGAKYIMLRDPVPRGLARNKFAVSYWQRT